MIVVKAKELLIKVPNKVGQLEFITTNISSLGISIRAISAYVENNQALFRILTSDNQKVKESLSAQNIEVLENEVVIIQLPDKVGELSRIAKVFKDNNIDLEYIYGTTTKPEEECVLICSSKNNDKIIEVLSSL